MADAAAADVFSAAGAGGGRGEGKRDPLWTHLPFKIIDADCAFL